jgi:hypothetical protein
MVRRSYERGKATNEATAFSIDDAIDPADSRNWVSSLLRSVRPEPRTGRRRAGVDAW